MPIRQNILRKGKAPKQNLLSFDVLQEETGVLGDLTTSRFFNISEFPAVLPSGNSSFLIEGSNLLKPEIELRTELLDAQGNPIFHYAIPNYNKELPARRIAIEVYDDEVVNGVGSFTILGELNPRQFDIPSEFQDTYNVRFTAPVSINREIKNTQPIRFYGDPTLSVSELVKGVIEKAPTGGSNSVSITGSVELINSNPQVQFSVDSGSTTGNSNQFEEVGNSVASYQNQNQGSAQSSILPPTTIPNKQFSFVVKEMEKGVDNALNKITSGMKGASFSITRPDLLVDSNTYPDSKFDKPQSFETKILDVINSSTFTTTTDYTITNKQNNNKLIVPFGASSSNATITHNVISSTETEDQVFKRSFANMTVGNLRTFSGDTYKAKIYMKEEGSSGEFEPIYETLVESPNELVNPSSISGFQNIGLFFTQSIIDNNWTTSSAEAPATQDDDTLIDGVLLSGSNAELGSSFTFVTKNTLSLEKNEDYIVEFNAAYLTAPKAQSDGTTKTLAELEVFITGSFETENQSEVSLGKVETTRGSLGGRFLPLKRQITDFKTHNGNSSPSGSLGFRVNSGQFKVSDIRLRPFSQTNFSPGFFKANVPMPKPIKRGKLYDFMVEFYDANNNLAETVALVDNISFQGPPQVIADGADGLLTGSLFISNVTGSGIELHGGSAYMRSIGYNGFDRTIGENLGGFLIFSGSVSESMGTSQSYEGVGLEIVDAHGDTDRFLKFRTNPSEFTVQTDQFFLGKEGQFISGSNGNIVISSSNFFLGGESTFVSGSNDKLEISSSNFHLDDDGSVTMQGTITAEAGGTIGGFTIGASSLAAGNVFQLSSSQDIEDPASMISSSKFKVSAGGQLTGSSVLLTGGTITGATTITSDVTIQGSVSANSILVPATIAGSPSTIANASASIDDKGNAVFRSGSIGGFNMDGTTLFSDSSEFVVTGSTGQITGSQVLFTGGKIGGFDIDAISIASSNGNLIMSSSGQITASSADLTGDLNATHIKASSGSIGGFVLDTEFINSVDGNISINSADKAIRISNNTFGNTGIQLEHNSGTPRAHIGKSDGEGFKFDGTNVVMSSSAFLLGSRAGGNSFVSGSNGEIEISGSAFHLLKGTITASNVDLSGRITAEEGEIGGFAITENAISSSNNELILRGDGPGTSAGQITGSRVLFSGGEIGGFLITNDTIETKDFVSGLKGVRLSTSDNGSLEVEEARIRGTLKTTVFEKETVNAVGGQLIVANSTAITGSDVAKTDTTMSVENVTGFAADEILLIKKVSGSGFSTEYVQVISSSTDFNSDTNFQGKLMVSRSFGSSATYNPSLHSGSITTTTATGSTYTTGQVIVSTGKINTGFIKLNANPNDSATPFIDIVERTGSGVFDVDLKARLGDLSGLSSGLVGSSPGFGLFSENVFLTGKITATSGEIAGWDIDSNILKSGTNIQLDSGNEKITISDQTFGNTGIQLEHNSGTPRAHIGKSNGEGFKFDGTNVVMSASAFQLGNNASFVSGSNGNVKISGSSVDIQTPAFIFGDLNKAFISGSNGNLELSSSNFILGTSGSNAAGGETGVGAYVSASNSKLRISSSAFDLNDDGTFNFANGKLTFDGSTLALDGTATIGGTAGSDFETNSSDKTAGSVGGWTITSNEIKSNSNKIILHQNNGKNGQIKIGSATSISSGDGVYMDGTGDFRVGDADGERIQFDLSESELILSSSAFKLGNNTSFVSGSNGNIKISGSSVDIQTPAFIFGDLNKAFISGSNGNLELSASNFILGTSGSNAAGGETGVGAYVSASNGKLRISASNFDLNDNGNFDFANGKLTFNGSTLSVNGNITIGNPGDIDVSTINNDSGFTDDTAANAAQAAVDVVESRVIITGADVTVAHNSGHNKGIFNAAGLTVIGNNQTGSLFGNFGAEVYGASDKNERLTIGSNGVSLIANNITGSVITAAGTTIFGASDKKERLDVNSDGVTLIANNVTGSFIDANGMEIYGASDKQEKAFINSDGMTVIAGNVTASKFGTDVVIGEVGASKSNVQITSGAINLRTNTTNKLTIAANGTITIGNNISLTAGGDATFTGALSGASGTFGGALSGGTISIGSSNSIFKADSNGIYLGNATFGSAPFRVTPAGAVTATNATITGAVTATSGDIGGWNINSNDLVGGAVRLEREGIISATGSTSVGGGTKQTKALFSGSADRGSVVAIQRDDFNGDLLDLVELHTSQSYVDDVLISYASGSDRDDVTFTRSGTSSDQAETLTFAAGGSGAGAWPSNIFIRASGTGATNGKKVVVETAMSDNQLLDTQEANNVVEIAFLNLTEQFLGSPVSSNSGKALVRYKIEIFQNDSNTATGAELLKTFNISSTLTLGASASAVNINQPIVLNKRYFFAKITGTNYDELNSADGDDNAYTFSQTAAPIVAVKYLPKVKLNGVGFQTFAGPNQEVKLGAKNEIIGDLQLKETVADTRGNLQVEGKGAFGTLTIDDTFDLFVDGEIGATGNITGFYSSDKRLKENIVEIKEGLSIINQLRPVKFDWKDDSPFAHLYPTEYGLIAQEVEEVVPEIVGTMKQDYKGINYESLVPLLISSIKELTKEVEELKERFIKK